MNVTRIERRIVPVLARTEEKVHVDHKDGAPLYDRLYLTNVSHMLLFESGNGFIDLTRAELYGWVVKEGWRK
jgi:hypothetical protein